MRQRGATQQQPRSRARRRALQALYQWQITGQDAGEISRQFHQAQDMSMVDDEFFQSLLFGVIQDHVSLDEQLQPFVDRPIAQLDLMEKLIIRQGTWELLHCPESPYKVVLDEAIDLAHRFGAENGHAFVNGVLDKAARRFRPDESA